MLALLLAILLLYLFLRTLYIASGVLMAEDVKDWADTHLYWWERPVIRWVLMNTMSPREKDLLQHLENQRQRRAELRSRR